MNKQQLANKIWESANEMRSKIEANEYKDYILGFIFYKYLSDQEEKFLRENDFSKKDIEMLSEEDYETCVYIQQNIGYFIEYKNLFSTWLKMGSDFSVDNVTTALSAFDRLIYKTHKKVFENIFKVLSEGLTKLGTGAKEQTRAISGLINLIQDIPMDGKQDYDVLGFIYEYLIGKFAANAGKKAGEFYTPHEVSLLMSEIIADHLKGKSEIKIYDPTSGSGSLLINIGKCVSKYMPDKNNIKYYAQELKLNTYNLTRMNLIMRGIKPDNIVVRNADTLEDDWPYFDEEDPINTYNPLYVDAVVSNPPYSQKWNPENKEHDPRYARFGITPKGKADYAFLLHDLYHVKPDGIMTIVLPHGVLFRGGEEGTIRKNLIEGNYIDAIIGLPANIFYGTSIPTIVMVLKQTRSTNDILIIDASKGFTKEGKNNKLRASDIRKIADTVSKRENVNKYSRVVSIEEIRKNDYNLNIPRYVDSSQEPESWDIYATMFGGIPLVEIESLSAYWQAFPNLKVALIKHIDAAYVELVSVDIKKTIKEHSDVIEYADNFKKAFDGFAEYLQETWINHMDSVNTNMSEMEVSKDIFKRLDNIPLVDKYDAYEILDKEWQTIATDLEIIQTEGYDSIRKVDPNLILQKKGDKKEEIQKGWKGHIIPFDLIQKEILYNEYEELKQKENRIAEISSEYEELFESLSEEEKDSEVVNDDSSAFVPKEIPKKLKELRKEEQSEEVVAFIQKLSKYEALNKEEKTLKKEIKNQTDQLHMKTKEVIENLSDDMIYELLTKKWIHNLIQNINKLPETIINNLVSKLQSIHKKYETTYLQIESEIKETSKQLAEMIDQLVGDEYDMKGLSEFKALLLGE